MGVCFRPNVKSEPVSVTMDLRNAMGVTTTQAKQNAGIGSTILLVEDEDQLRSALAQFLSRKGFRVVEAQDGRSAEGVLRKAFPDLIVTDLIMPDRDGLELLEFVRQHAPSVPVIAMSGGGRISPANYLEIAQRLGAVRTLEKPFPTTQLLNTLQEVLSQRPTQHGDHVLNPSTSELYQVSTAL